MSGHYVNNAWGREFTLDSNSRVLQLCEHFRAIELIDDANVAMDECVKCTRAIHGPSCHLALFVRGLGRGHFKITRWQTIDGKDRIYEGQPWSTGQELAVRLGGFFGEMVQRGQPMIVHGLNIRDDAVFGDELASYRSLMAVPFFVDGKPFTWTVLLDPDPDAFGEADIEDLLLRGNLIATAINRTELSRELSRAHAYIQMEVDNIADILQSLHPLSLDDIPGLGVAVRYETFDRAGGDYNDVLPLVRDEDGKAKADSPWCILIADAAGHGPAAAVVVAMFHSLLHHAIEPVMSPSAMLEELNRRLFQRRIGHSIVTVFLAIYDPVSRRLSYANAGHVPPLLRKKGGDVQRLDDVGGIPLGVLDFVDSQDGAVDLEAGDAVLLYTDGISEANAPDGVQLGLGRLSEIFAQAGDSHGDILQKVVQSVREHEQTTRPTDDQTIMALVVDPDGSGKS